jgi:NAD(P)-dependent dehydrogenase (short-subunit alcohol dehydrogenase family)
MTDTSRYAGQNVYISGGSSGIGLAAAKAFVTLGADLFLFSRKSGSLQDAAEQLDTLRVSPDQRISWATADVCDREGVAAALDKAVSSFGRPHVVINSAGIAYPDNFEHFPFAMFDQTIKTNLYGIWNVLSCLVPAMKPSGGRIVNVSSVAGFIGIFGYTAYSASKFGVIGMSESLRCELKPHNITVSVLCPPDTDTPGLAQENLTKPPETKAIAGNARLLSPEYVAHAMVRGMEKGQFLIIPGFEGKFYRLMNHLLPGVVMRIMDSQVRSVRRRQNKVLP